MQKVIHITGIFHQMQGYKPHYFLIQKNLGIEFGNIVMLMNYIPWKEIKIEACEAVDESLLKPDFLKKFSNLF